MKVCLLDTDTGRQASARSPTYDLRAPREGWSEQDPETWLDALAAAAEGLGGAQGAGPGVDAVCLTGQMHGAVVVGAAGRALRPAILWPDLRAGAEVCRLADAFGAETLRSWTGSAPSANHVLPKLLWMQAHESGTLRQASRFLLPKDWVRARLGGAPVTEPTDGSGTGLMDLGSLAWRPELLAVLGPAARLAPEIVPSASVVGRLSSEWARRLGVRAGSPLLAGAGDLPAAVLASGARGAAQPVFHIGSAAQVAVVRGPEALGRRGAQAFCHPDPRWRIGLGTLLAAGLAVRWARERLGGVELPPPAHVPRLVFVPHLAGERGPLADLASKGAWVGLGLETGPADMAAAAAYGVVLALREALGRLSGGAGPGDPRVLAEGPFARDWAERLANGLGTPVRLVAHPSPSALGACGIAAVAIGAATWDDLTSRVPVALPIRPDPEAARRLEALHAAFRDLRGPLLAASAALEAAP